MTHQRIVREQRMEPLLRDPSYSAAALQLQKDRKAAGLTRSQMAALLDMEFNNYNYYERGEKKPSPVFAKEIQDILYKVRTGELKPPILNKEPESDTLSEERVSWPVEYARARSK